MHIIYKKRTEFLLTFNKNALFEKLQKGEITVATDVDGAESKAYSNVTLDWVK